MKTTKIATDPTTAIWQRRVEFQGLCAAAARALLKLQFSELDQCRMHDLSKKAQAGTLTPEEQAELDTFEQLACLLGILHSKARRALSKKPKRAY